MEAGVNWRIREKTKQNTHKITNRQKRKDTDTITNPTPLTTKETNAKADIGSGNVSKSAGPVNSAPRDSSALCTIPRTRELP